MSSRPSAHALRSALVLGAALLAAPDLSAQFRHPGQPAATRLVPGPVPTFGAMAPDVAPLRAEDAANEAARVPGPLRFGVMLPTPFVFEDVAAWELTEDGETLVGRVAIHAAGAYSLGVEWAEYELPAAGKLFLYDPDMTTVLGAYTAAERISTGEFVVEPFPGDHVVLEYQQPAALRDMPHMAVRGVIYDYRDVFALERELFPQAGDGSYSGGCDVNVNCPEGDPYELQKRATVRTTFGGGLCSGVILNNVLEDRTPYLYTANHCGTGSTVNVRFNYQNVNCSGGSASFTSLSGATLLDNDVDTDGRLLRLNSNIPDSYNPYYAGWSRSNVDPTFGMSMHHPGGGTKKISIDFNGGGKGTNNFIGIGTVKTWDMAFNIGGTAGGSSGGPLFDQDGVVRGTLTGGPDSACNISLYGRFHNFWNDDLIGEWLDPTGTGVQFLEGYDPFGDLTAAVLVSVNPASGPAGGLTPVTLSGVGFDGVTAVAFGGVNAADVDVVSGGTITCTPPAGTAGSTVDVAVTDGFGTSTLVAGFSYTADPAPDVSTVAPASGDVDGGNLVTISGASVIGVTGVTFGGVAGTDLTLVDASTLKVRVPAAAGPGPVDVEVIGNGSDVLVDGYGYTQQGEFVVVGPGHPGFSGLVPNLFGSGDLIPGGAGFTITTSGAAPNAFGVTFVSAVVTPVPFKGGTLYTLPILLDFPVQTTFLGTVQLPVSLDASFPSGLEIVVQQAFQDGAASQGVSLSNGLKVITGTN